MPSEAIAGVGTEFQRGDGASNEVFTKLSEVTSIAGPNLTKAQIEVTSLDSLDGFREFITGFKDPGEITLEMNYTRDGYATLKEDFDSEDEWNYQIVFPDDGNTTLSFAAFVTGITVNTPFDDKVSMTVTFKIDGPVTMTS